MGVGTIISVAWAIPWVRKLTYAIGAIGVVALCAWGSITYVHHLQAERAAAELERDAALRQAADAAAEAELERENYANLATLVTKDVKHEQTKAPKVAAILKGIHSDQTKMPAECARYTRPMDDALDGIERLQREQSEARAAAGADSAARRP